MPKFNFAVEVTGAVEAWEVALWIKDCVNEEQVVGRGKGIFVESVEELDPLVCYHAEAGCDCEDE